MPADCAKRIAMVALVIVSLYGVSSPASGESLLTTTYQLDNLTLRRPLAVTTIGSVASGDAFIVSTGDGHIRLAPSPVGIIVLGNKLASPDALLAEHDSIALLTTKDGGLQAAHVTGGASEWEAFLPARVTAMICGGQTSFVASADGVIASYRIDDGTIGWQHDLGVGIIALLLAGDTNGEVLLAAADDGKVIGINPADGAVLWKLTLPVPMSGTPIVAGGKMCCPLRNGAIALIDWRQQQILAASETLAFAPLSPTWTGQNYVIAAGQELLSVDQGGNRRWQVMLPATATAAPLATGDGVWVALDDGSLRLYSGADGTEIRNWSLAGAKARQLIGGATALFMIDWQQHALILAAPDAYQDVVDTWLPDTSPNQVAFAETAASAVNGLVLSAPMITPEGWLWPYTLMPDGYQAQKIGLFRCNADGTQSPLTAIALTDSAMLTVPPEPPTGWFTGATDGCLSPSMFVDYQLPQVALSARRQSAAATADLVVTVRDEGVATCNIDQLAITGAWDSVSLLDQSGTTAYGAFDSAVLATWELPTAVGEQTFRLTATDAAGNKAEAFSTLIFDNIPPYLTISLQGNLLPTANGTKAAPGCQVVASAEDNDGQSPNVEYCLDSGLWSAYSEPLIFSEDGNYYVTVRASDAAGNISAPQAIALIVDATPPAMPLLSGIYSGACVGVEPVSFLCVNHAQDSPVTYRALLENGEGGQWQLAGNGPAYAISSSEIPEGFYTLTVIALDELGNTSMPMQVTNIICDITPPHATANPATPGIDDLTATPQSLHNIFLKATERSTDDRSGVSGINIYRSSEDGEVERLGIVSDGAIALVDLPPANAEYEYYACPVDRAGNIGPESNRVVVQIAADTATPQGPFGLHQQAIDLSEVTSTGDGVRVRWDEDRPLDDYGISMTTVYRAAMPIVDAPAEGVTMIAELAGDPGQFTDTDLLAEGFAYYYAVVAADPSGNVSPLGFADTYPHLSAIADRTPPQSLTINGEAGSGIDGLAASVADGMVTLNWSADVPADNVGIHALEVWRRVSDGEEQMIAEDPDYGDGPAFVDAAVPGNLSCAYRVRGRDAAGNLQEWSNVATVAAIPDIIPPAALTVPATAGIDNPMLKLTAGSGVMIDWQHDPASDPSGIAAYRIYRATEPFSEPGLPAELVMTVPTSTSGELRWHDALIGISAVTLYYAVTAIDDFGNEGMMAAPSVITVPDRPPVITLALANNSIVRGTLPISGSILDNQLLRYECAVDTGIGYTIFASGFSVPGNGVLGTLNTAKLPDGVCRIRVTAFDVAGLNSAAMVSVRVDNTAPAFAISLPATNFVVRDALNLSLTATDANGLQSWLLAVTASNGDTLWQQFGGASTSFQAVYPIALNGANGKITLRWQVIDAAGNVKTGSRAGTLLAAAPAAASVLITELDMTPDEGPRWAELTAIHGPVNIAGWKLTDLDGTDTMLAIKPVTLQTGDLVAVYWGDGDDEVDAAGGGWTDLDNNGVRDLYLSDPAPNTTDDQIALLNGDAVVDAVIISDYDGSLPTDESTDMGWLYDRWGWNEDGRNGGQQVAAQLNLPGWGSIGRIPGAPDEGRKADWAGMRPTPGMTNEYAAPLAVGSVLINEVKIDDFFDTEQDWVELYCVNGPVDVGNLVLSDLDTIEEERLLTSEAPFTLNTGEYCVVHLLPVTGENETDNASSDSWTDVNGNGIRDIYATMTQLQGTDEQLALYALDGTIIDAMCWSNCDNGIDDELWDNQALVEAGAWTGDGGQEDAAYLQSHLYTLGRVPNAQDSNRNVDWQPCVLTPGAENVSVGDDHMPPQTWLESWGPLVGDGTDTYIAPWSQFYMRSFDDLSGVAEKWIIIDGAPEQIYSDPIVFATEGWHTIGYYGVDNAGNAEPEHTLRVYVDVTAPQVVVSLDAQNRLVIAATDDAAGVGDIQFSHVGQSLTEYTGPVAFYGPGEYVVTYCATDKAENSISDSVVLMVPDIISVPTLAELPVLTNLTTLSVGGQAESGRLVRVLNDGSVVTVVRAAKHEVTVSASDFNTRDASIAEESGMLTVTPYSELWSDNFADGDMAGWYVVGGTTRVENGELVIEGNGFAAVEQRTICSVPEFSMTGVIRDETDQWETDIAYYVTDWNLYRLVEYNPNNVQFQRHQIAGDNWQAIGPLTTMPEYAIGKPLPYRIDKYADGTMRGFIGGAEVHGADQLYTSGHLRFWGWDPDQNKHIKIVLDDVRVFTGAPRYASAQGNTVDLSGLGRIVAVRADVVANAGIIDIWTGTDEANRTQLYTLAGSNLASLTPALELQHPRPEAARPMLGTITLRGMGDYSAGISLHEGPNVLTAAALNEAGEQGEASEERVVILDTQEPVLTGISVSPATFTPENGSTTLDLTLADNQLAYPGSLRVAVQNGAGAEVRELLNVNPAAYGTRSVVWDGRDAGGGEVVAGVYRFVITAADAAGNQVTASAEVRVQSDATPPAIAISGPQNGAQLSYTQMLTPQWTVSDTESGLASSSATLDGQPLAVGTTVELLTLGIGSHTLAVSATDNAGNSSNASVSFSVIDDMPPTIILQQPTTPTNQDVNLVYTATDVITPAEQLVITGNTSPYSAEGNHSVALTATDAAGNSATSNTVAFIIDKTAPVTELTVGMPQYGEYVMSATPLTLTATDNLPSVAAMRYRINGGDWQAYSGAFTLAGEGSHTVGYASTDVAGNIESEKSINLTVDATAPECALTLDLTDSTGNIAVPETLVTLTASDVGAGVAGIEYDINGGGWQAYTAPFEVRQTGITSGQLAIAYRATDKLGNVSAGQSRAVTVKAALELSAGLLNAPRVLAWWNEPAGGQYPSKDASMVALRTVLDSAALNYRIVESATDFKAALGDYNVYLILGDQATLDDAGETLVAAQVALGKTLLSFGYEDIGTPESTDRGWSNIFGVKVAGVLNGTSELIVSQGDLAADTMNLVIEGQTERITEVLSGDVLGTVMLTESGERNGGNGNGTGGNGIGGSNQEADPAVVVNGWGLGRVLYAVPEYSRNLAGLVDVLRGAVAWATPVTEVAVPGGSVALRIAVKNAVLPLTLRVNVEALVPTGGDVVAVYNDGEDRGNVVVWFDDLEAAATGEYRCVLRLPNDLANCVVHIDAAYLKNGMYRTVETIELPIQ